MARYNAKGEEKVSPFIYCQTPQYAATLEIRKIPEQLKSTGNVKIDVNPCEDFRFIAAKDEECNIDIYIHTNPKHLAKNIPSMFRAISKIAVSKAT